MASVLKANSFINQLKDRYCGNNDLANIVANKTFDLCYDWNDLSIEARNQALLRTESEIFRIDIDPTNPRELKENELKWDHQGDYECILYNEDEFNDESFLNDHSYENDDLLNFEENFFPPDKFEYDALDAANQLLREIDDSGIVVDSNDNAELLWTADVPKEDAYNEQINKHSNSGTNTDNLEFEPYEYISPYDDIISDGIKEILAKPMEYFSSYEPVLNDSDEPDATSLGAEQKSQINDIYFNLRLLDRQHEFYDSETYFSLTDHQTWPQLIKSSPRPNKYRQTNEISLSSCFLERPPELNNEQPDFQLAVHEMAMNPQLVATSFIAEQDSQINDMHAESKFGDRQPDPEGTGSQFSLAEINMWPQLLASPQTSDHCCQIGDTSFSPGFDCKPLGMNGSHPDIDFWGHRILPGPPVALGSSQKDWRDSMVLSSSFWDGLLELEDLHTNFASDVQQMRWRLQTLAAFSSSYENMVKELNPSSNSWGRPPELDHFQPNVDQAGQQNQPYRNIKYASPCEPHFSKEGIPLARLPFDRPHKHDIIASSGIGPWGTISGQSTRRNSLTLYDRGGWHTI